jgi:hypothetical protein
VTASPESKTVRSRAVATRVVRLAWVPGQGPEVLVNTRRRNVPVVHKATLVSAVLTYTWEHPFDRWRPVVELAASLPQGRGWSRFPTPITNNRTESVRAAIAALHAEHGPTSTVTFTETEPTP